MTVLYAQIALDVCSKELEQSQKVLENIGTELIIHGKTAAEIIVLKTRWNKESTKVDFLSVMTNQCQKILSDLGN